MTTFVCYVTVTSKVFVKADSKEEAEQKKS